MARKRSGSKKSRKPSTRGTHQSSVKVKTGYRPKHSGRISAKRRNGRVRELDALNLYRRGKAKSVSAAASTAGTTLKRLWERVPRAISKDRRSGRLHIKPTDPYSEKVEILTDAGALVVTARGSRQRQRAGQHRATYMEVVQNKKPASALEEFRDKKVGGHELLSDYSRLQTLAKAGVLGKLGTLYVSAGGGR
jgi:hypothetical protein